MCQQDDAVESQRLLLVIHLHVAVIFGDCFPDAFQAEAVPYRIRFAGQFMSSPVRRQRGKRIAAAGVGDGYDNVRRIFVFICGYLDKSVRETFAGFHSIVQQIAEQGSDIIFRHELQDTASDVGQEGNVQGETLLFIAAQDRI